LFAVAATVVFITPAYTVAFLQEMRVRTGRLYHTGSFMTECHVGALVMNISPTNARVGNANEYVVGFKVLSLGLRLLDSIFGTPIHGELNRHYVKSVKKISLAWEVSN
jgi:hypothetical protein